MGLKQAKYISILVDTVTDIGNPDLEVVYVRYLKNGIPTNVFLGVEGNDASDRRSTIESGKH